MSRNDKVLGELLKNEYGYFYRLAFGYVRNEMDAQDIIQESAYKAIYHSDRLKHPEFAKTWLSRIVINEAVSFLRKQKNREMPLDFLEETAVAENTVGCDSRENTMDLREAIRQLAPEEQTVIILRFFEDMKLEEIAEICEESVNTIKSRLYRTLKKLKLDLEA